MAINLESCPTKYYGFEMSYSKKGENLSYYEKAVRQLREAPFISQKDKEEFNYPIEKWGEYCDKHKIERRKNYKKEFFSIEEVERRSPGLLEIKRGDSRLVKIIISPQAGVDDLEIDAVVNSANETLLGGGGIDFKIHQAAGPLLLKECAFIPGGCEVGEAKITKGYNHPAKYVLHTVGPIFINNERPDEDSLTRCYISCLEKAEEFKLKSIVFPWISCGIYGFPKRLSAQLVVGTLIAFVKERCVHLENILIAARTEEKVQLLQEEFTRDRNS
jgi:O-acetyl-ADP-ribose deacetylase (regulator of RNase III)